MILRNIFISRMNCLWTHTLLAMLLQFCTHQNNSPGSNGLPAFAECLQVQDVQSLLLARTRTQTHTAIFIDKAFFHPQNNTALHKRTALCSRPT